MTKLPAAIVLAALVFLPFQYACASADYLDCQTHWNLQATDPDCNNLGFLSPGNDTRVNLQMLRADHGFASLPENVSQSTKASNQGGAPQAEPQTRPFSRIEIVRGFYPSPREEGSRRALDHDQSSGEEDKKPQSSLPDFVNGLGLSWPSTIPSHMFARGEGGRCLSNDENSAKAFLEQVAATPLSVAERKALAESRLAILQWCNFDAAQIAKFGVIQSQSPAGLQFARYLQGAAAFYAGDFDTARGAFQELAASDHPWLKETAYYMVARTALNQAQKNFEGNFGAPDFNAVDKTAASAADAGFEEYLKRYPQGLYVGSAQGLRRRIAWLLQDKPRFATELAKALAVPDSVGETKELPPVVEEADSKLLIDPTVFKSLHDPMLLAVSDLMNMRQVEAVDADARSPLTAADLKTQEPLFANQPELYRYLLGAQAYYVEHDPVKALAILPSVMPASPPGYLGFSQQVLRGMALESLEGPKEAQKLWLSLLGQAHRPLQRAVAELALAANFERGGQIDALFAPSAPKLSTDIHRILLTKVAGATLLRQVSRNGATAEDRAVALYTLLYKEITRSQFADFVTDAALIPADVAEPPAESWALDSSDLASTASLALFRWDGKAALSFYSCPGIGDVARLLARDPQSPKDLNCLGEFILRNRLDGYSLDDAPPVDDLGGTPSQFLGKRYSRLDGYMQVMDNSAASRDDRAYALYRAIRCFAPSGDNGCGPQSVPEDTRKEWFHRLKTQFRNSKWSDDLKYYW